ncbi:MAG TPA: hypothetical protein VLJ76_02940 [Gaiellaceae bacterium]|nr:hypothetical protein [Gaiellaceae bacterium]
MLRLASVAAALALALAGCGGSGDSAAKDAVRHVIAQDGNPWRLFLTKPGSISCRIQAGGVVTTILHGTCSTLVTVHKDGSAVVRFVEAWGSSSASYTMEYTVAKSGRITGYRNYGVTPPQYGA